MADFMATSKKALKAPKEVFMTVEEIDEVLLKGHEEALLLNSSKSTEFVTNNRGQKLNIRSVWPAESPTGFIIFLHAFALHSNRPTEQYLGNYFVDHGFGTIFIDFHGHGHSEGRRCYINQSNDLIDDVISVLLALFAESNEGPDFFLVRNARGLPFFFMGHSTGANVSAIVGNILTIDRDAKVLTEFSLNRIDDLVLHASPCFKGVILLTPMVKVPAIIKRVVGSIGCVLPNATLPNIFRSDDKLGNMLWASPKYFKYVMSDRYPTFKHGMVYWGGSRIPTLRSVVSISTQIRQAIEQCSFPMLILHDKFDEFVSIDGSHELMELCPSPDKRLILVPNGMHDPLTNRLDYVCKFVVEWVLNHCS